jgi:hypothetical protein
MQNGGRWMRPPFCICLSLFYFFAAFLAAFFTAFFAAFLGAAFFVAIGLFSLRLDDDSATVTLQLTKV